jgi:Holliday junction resolvase RusA-like endonuclease
MNNASFFMAMEPPTITAQCQKIGVSKTGKKYVYKDAKLLAAQAKLTAHLAQHAPEIPADDAVRLSVKWLFRGSVQPDGTPKTTKPDTDNLQKMLKDSMTRVGFWRDDALVAEEFCGKYWAQTPGIYVKVEAI